MQSIHPQAFSTERPFDAEVSRTNAREEEIAGERVGTTLVFLATLAPLLTVTSLRRLIVDVHGGRAGAVHVFVALGMVGASIGTPLIARALDRRGGGHLRVAGLLAIIDAIVTFLTPVVPATWMLFALRPIHGVASMGLLSILLGRFRDAEKSLVSRAGGAMIGALALGPAIGGLLGRHGSVEQPFGVAAACSACLAAVLLSRPAESQVPSASSRTHRATGALVKVLALPLVVLFVQRFAIGGFVATYAVHARAVYRMSDALVGASFSLMLVMFAATTCVFGRRAQEAGARSRASSLITGASLFGLAFLMIASGERRLLGPALILAGIGAALQYAPALGAIVSLTTAETRTSSLAIAQAAGALGMIVGPLAAGLLDHALHQESIATRCGSFFITAGLLQLLTIAIVALFTARRSTER